MFPDGMLPEQAIIDKWLNIVDEFFDSNTEAPTNNNVKLEKKGKERGGKMDTFKAGDPSPPRIGVHCVAGLGRAPLLVALALVHKGCPRINAIELIRKNRPGALNMIQANYLIEYKDKRKTKGDANGNASCNCLIF